MGTIEYIDGFDDYFGYVLEGWSKEPSAVGGGRVSGFGHREIGSNGKSRSVTPDARYTAEFAWLTQSNNSSFDLVSFYEAGTLHGKIRIESDNTLRVIGGPGGTTTLATSAAFVVASTWYHVGFDYNVHDSTGSFDVRINEVSIASGSGVDTRNGGTGVINLLDLAPHANISVWYDDLVLTKGGGFQGDCRVITQTADAAGTNSDWTPTSPPSCAYQTVGTQEAGGTAINVSWPAHQVDDIGLLFIETCGGEPASITGNYLWEEIPNSPQATGIALAGTRLTAYWTRAQSSSMPDVSVGDSGDHQIGVIAVIRGCAKSGSPIDITSGGVKASASGSATITGVTTTVDNALIVQVISADLDSTGTFASAQTNANLTGITERFDYLYNGGNGGGLSFITATKTTAGATGDTAVTVTSSINAFMTIALKPAGTENYASANDPLTNDDLDYVSSSTSGNRDTYSWPALGETGTVKAVAIHHSSRKDNAGSRKLVTVIRDGSTNYDNATEQTLSTTYAGQQQIYEEDPSTNDPWIVSNVDAREYGVKVSS
jgi:hypothetical protein